MSSNTELPQDPKVSEVFNLIKVPEGVNVVPVTFQIKEHDTRFLIAIQGQEMMAKVILSKLMDVIQDMNDKSEQMAQEQDDKPVIILS